MSDSISAIIVAAGAGRRLRAQVPKAFIDLGGKQLLSYSMAVFSAHPLIEKVVAVIPRRLKERVQQIAAECGAAAKLVTTEGGEHRWNSVCNGVIAAGDRTKWVCVHDAARPFVTPQVIDSLIRMRTKYRCAITASPIMDTIRTYDGDTCIETIDRNSLVRVGTPQLFHRESLLAAFEHAKNAAEPPTDEAMLMESMGIPVGLAWGDPLNFKITTKEDLEMAEALLAHRRG